MPDQELQIFKKYLVCPIGASNIIDAIEINIRVHKEVKNNIGKNR